MQKLRSAKDRRLTPIAAIRPETPPWRQRVDFEFGYSVLAAQMAVT